MLLEDTHKCNRMPASCVKLLQNLLINTNATEILIGLVHYIFLESGFVPNDVQMNIHDLPIYWGYSYVAQIPDRYSICTASSISNQQKEYLNNSQLDSNRSPTHTSQHEPVYKFALKLLNFAEPYNLPLVIRKIFSGDTLCITFCYKNQTQSICLHVTDYIRNDMEINVEDLCLNPNAYLIQVDNLVFKIKHNVIASIRNLIMLDGGYRFASLVGLPKEIFWLLLKRLDLISQQNLSQTCRTLRNGVIQYLRENNLAVTTERKSTPIIREIN